MRSNAKTLLSLICFMSYIVHFEVMIFINQRCISLNLASFKSAVFSHIFDFFIDRAVKASYTQENSSNGNNSELDFDSL